MTEGPRDFSIAQKSVHWLMAFLIIAMLIAGHGFNDPEKELADRLWSRGGHGSGGIVVGVFLVLRLVMRFRRGVPADDGATPPWQAALSRVSHWGMYAMIAALVASGIAVGLYTTDPMTLPVLGGFNISLMQNTSEVVYQQVRLYHSWITDIAIGFVGLHVIAAFYHLFWLKDRIMPRMAVFWRSEKDDIETQATDVMVPFEERRNEQF